MHLRPQFFELRFPQHKTIRITTVTAPFVRSKSVVGLIFFSQAGTHLFTWVDKETSGDVTWNGYRAT